MLLANQSFVGRTTNVSRGGLCATMADPIALGVDLEVDVALVFEDTQSEPLRLPARVVWCTVVDEAYQIGLSFRPLSADHTKYLTVFLRYLEEECAEPRVASDNIDERFR